LLVIASHFALGEVIASKGRVTAATATEFVTLTSPHLPRLFRVGLRLTREPNESDDLVQEALAKAWASWSRFDRGASLGAWLSRILVNTFISRYRHQKVVGATAARADLIDHLFDPHRVREAREPERRWHEHELSDEIVGALASLPAHFRQVVELVDLGGLPYRDAARELDIPVGTVMSRLHRARRRLRGTLADYARTQGFGTGKEDEPQSRPRASS
jgi:RNA polymerase sigma-70 factor (ECF subfamily)